jgi:4'-phosphopantetheinyl transferase
MSGTERAMQRSATTPMGLRADEVHVWRVLLTADSDPHLDWLSSSELERLERRLGEQRHQFAVAHSAMRAVIGQYLGCAPTAVPIEAPYGAAPRVPGLGVSLAHGDGLALVAVANAAVGVDVESVETAQDPDLDDIAAATLSEPELAQWRELPRTDRARAWLQCWVRKEAVLKAAGEGLSDRLLAEVNVASDRHGALLIVNVDVGPDHCAAVAVAHPGPHVRVMEANS